MPEKIANVDKYIDTVKDTVTADTEGKARIASYEFPLATTLIKSALHCAFDLLNGTMNAENMADTVAVRANDVADDKNFTITAYNTVLTNVFMAYVPGFEIVK